MLCCVVFCCVVLCCVVLCCVVLCCVVLCCVVLCCVVLCCVVLCCVVMCCVVLCWVGLCYVMLRCVVLCCVQGFFFVWGGWGGGGETGPTNSLFRTHQPAHWPTPGGGGGKAPTHPPTQPGLLGPQSGEKSIWVYDPCLLSVPILRANQYGCQDRPLRRCTKSLFLGTALLKKKRTTHLWHTPTAGYGGGKGQGPTHPLRKPRTAP